MNASRQVTTSLLGGTHRQPLVVAGVQAALLAHKLQNGGALREHGAAVGVVAEGRHLAVLLGERSERRVRIDQFQGSGIGATLLGGRIVFQVTKLPGVKEAMLTLLVAVSRRHG